MNRLWIEDYAIGERFVSPARTITEGDVHAFAALTGDWHPLHTDAEAAATSRFKERIAHGLLVLSAGLPLLFRLGLETVLPRSFIAFYGIERLRFPNPVRFGDTIHAIGEVREARPKSEQIGILTYEVSVVRQDDCVCCSMQALLACSRKPN